MITMPMFVCPDLDTPPEITFLRFTNTRMHADRRFVHERYWQLLAHDCHLRAALGEEVLDITPGCFLLCPPRVPVTLHYRGDNRHLAAHFLPAADQGGPPLPVLRRHHPAGEQLRADFLTAIRVGPRQPQRARALVWAILWRLIDEEAAPDRLVAQARDAIEAGRYADLHLAGLAADCGCSVNTLIRRFKAALGTTPIAWQRRRQVERARYLLATLGLPPRQVAAELGFPSLQRFNKFIRQQTGCSPRGLATGSTIDAGRPDGGRH